MIKQYFYSIVYMYKRNKINIKYVKNTCMLIFFNSIFFFLRFNKYIIVVMKKLLSFCKIF